VKSEFTLAEQKAYELLSRLLQKEELKKQAVGLIASWWRAKKAKLLEK
jgi:hypothetical protein